MPSKMSYESAFKELQVILNELQNEEVSLDELSLKIKRASELSNFCKTKLRSIEEEIEKLNSTNREDL